MLNYIAAAATAVTLMIGSIPVASAAEASRPVQKEAAAKLGASSAPVPVRITTDNLLRSVYFDDVQPYLLSVKEQRALGRALVRSVRFIDSLT